MEGWKEVHGIIIKFRFHVRIHFHMCCIGFLPAPDPPPSRISWFQELLHAVMCAQIGGR
jgi:hypothetical protein